MEMGSTPAIIQGKSPDHKQPHRFSLWHTVMFLDPRKNLMDDIQRTVVDFFWSEQHWQRAAVLYLPTQEVG